MWTHKDLILRVRALPWLAILLRITDILSVVFTVFAFVVTAVSVALTDLFLGVRLLLVCGIPFVIVSLVRKLIDAPRPCELYGIDLQGEEKEGCSFPSRHAFSTFSIGTAMAFIYPLAAAATLLLGIFICVSRVLLGKHFVRDVVTGAIVGIASSLFGMIVLYL